MSIDIQQAYKVLIDFPFGKLEPILNWCRINCTDEWKFEESQAGYAFYFESDRDYITFLMWNK